MIAETSATVGRWLGRLHLMDPGEGVEHARSYLGLSGPPEFDSPVARRVAARRGPTILGLLDVAYLNNAAGEPVATRPGDGRARRNLAESSWSLPLSRRLVSPISRMFSPRQERHCWRGPRRARILRKTSMESHAQEVGALAIIGGLRRRMASSDAGAQAALVAFGRRTESDLREHAETILFRAVSAVDPEAAVACSLRAAPLPLSADGRVWIVALGKAAAAMARGASQALAGRVAGGMIAVPPGYPTAVPEPIRRFVSGHPVPDARSVEAGVAALEIVGGASADDLVLALLSGGGSSVAALPKEGLRVEEVAEATLQLIRAGAPSSDLAAVRKRLDGLKAGGLALRCERARGLVLAVSDVASDRPDLVASGPMSPDPTRIGEVRSILRRHGVWTELPLAVRGYLERCLAGEIAETPKAGHPCFSRIETRVVAGPKAVAEAALHEAERLGYESQVLSSELVGDAREVGRLLGEMARSLAGKRRSETPPQCVIATGATTIQGGPNDRAARNQELVLQGALEIEGIASAILASVGTDGTDGTVPAAGALATGETVRRARESGLDIGTALEEHDGYELFRTLRDLVVTGTTGAHVGDVQVLMLG